MMGELEEFEAKLDSAIADLENLAAEAPELFKMQMNAPLVALSRILEEVSSAVDRV